MNSVVENAANTVYERARFRSAQTVRDEKRDFAQRMATRRGSSNLPLSGPEFQAVLKMSGDHVERCIRERFESYRDAFKQADNPFHGIYPFWGSNWTVSWTVSKSSNTAQAPSTQSICPCSVNQ